MDETMRVPPGIPHAHSIRIARCTDPGCAAAHVLLLDEAGEIFAQIVIDAERLIERLHELDEGAPHAH
jgi:hypothetical protein